jgi:hypothetical protein
MPHWRSTFGTALVAATALLLVAAPAQGAITIGQVADPTGSDCGADFDFVNISVSTGNPYTVPGTGTITSWTMFGAGPAGQQFTFKVFRKVAEPSRYQVVGHAGPQILTLGGTANNTFPASIAVKPGDTIGFHAFTPHNACGLPGIAGTFGQEPVDLSDGQSFDFPEVMAANPLNLEATFLPDNKFKLASINRNKKKGTAILGFDLPNPGTLRAKGSGAKVSFASTGPIGGVVSPDSTPSLLRVRATGSKRRQLNETGAVKLKLKVTYTPTGGDPKTRKQKVKLRKLVG